MDNAIKNDCNRNLGINEICYFPAKNNELGKIKNILQYFMKSSGSINDISSSETNISYKNNVFELQDYHIILKSSNEFTNELFKNFSEDNCLCNYLIFQKSIDIYKYMDSLKRSNKKITLSDYFDCFNKASIFSLEVPFIEKNGSVTNNFFNPTLSSMVLIVKKGKNEREIFYNNWAQENFKITSLPNSLIKYEFYESNPPYNRDILDTKINNIYKSIGLKKLSFDKVIKDKSYFCLLWSPGDTNKNNSSFLSYYSFDFKLLGSLILKNNDNKWFTSFSYNSNIYKDFKKDYLYKANMIKNFIENYDIKDGNNKKNLFSFDYKIFLYNS
jgi:hypothetical protein